MRKLSLLICNKNPTKNCPSLFVIFNVFSGCVRDMTSYLAVGKKWKWHVELGWNSASDSFQRYARPVRDRVRVHSPYWRLTALSVDNSLVLLFVLSLLNWHSMALGTLWASIGKRKARERHGMCRRSAAVLHRRWVLIFSVCPASTRKRINFLCFASSRRCPLIIL